MKQCHGTIAQLYAQQARQIWYKSLGLKQCQIKVCPKTTSRLDAQEK